MAFTAVSQTGVTGCGIGDTWEHDLHLYIRRAYASEYLLGTSDWHRDRLASLIL